jgi:hypothetical protein
MAPSHLSPFFSGSTGLASQHDMNTEQVTVSAGLLFCIREVPGSNLDKITRLKHFSISPTLTIILSRVLADVTKRRELGSMIGFTALIHSTRNYK